MDWNAPGCGSNGKLKSTATAEPSLGSIGTAVPCHYDITTIDWHWIPRVDLVCGGFPCQPFSVAGKRRGADDDRYLWPEVVRCLAVLRPTWFLGENVYGLLHLGIEQMYADLEALGYQVAILGIPACAVDAPHLRKRIWILANAECNGSRSRWAERERQQRTDALVCNSGDVADAAHVMQHGGGDAGQTRRSESPDGGAFVAYSESSEERRTWSASREQQESIGGRSTQSGKDDADSDQQSMGRSTKPWCQRRQWPAEPAVGRVVDGVPHRVDRLKGLGNAIVPAIAEALGRMILEVA